MIKSPERRAEDAGADAWRAGIGPDKNPLPISRDGWGLGAFWLMGWRRARYEHRRQLHEQRERRRRQARPWWTDGMPPFIRWDKAGPVKHYKAPE